MLLVFGKSQQFLWSLLCVILAAVSASWNRKRVGPLHDASGIGYVLSQLIHFFFDVFPHAVDLTDQIKLLQSRIQTARQNVGGVVDKITLVNRRSHIVPFGWVNLSRVIYVIKGGHCHFF
jgi:hypothetical protein